jgi:hypothetical protein
MVMVAACGRNMIFLFSKAVPYHVKMLGYVIVELGSVCKCAGVMVHTMRRRRVSVTSC